MRVACQKHDFPEGSDVCSTCGANRDERESLESMERELTVVPKPTETKEAPKKRSKKTVISQEEQAVKFAVSRANAKTIVEGIEGAKKLAVEQLLGMDFSAAKITGEEEAELVGILTRFLDSVGWDLSNPKATLAMLLLAEVRITLRQYQQLRTVKVEDAVSKPQ